MSKRGSRFINFFLPVGSHWLFAAATLLYLHANLIHRGNTGKLLDDISDVKADRTAFFFILIFSPRDNGQRNMRGVFLGVVDRLDGADRPRCHTEGLTGVGIAVIFVETAA